MKILVTGGGGFLGQALCRGLVERGHAVTSFNRGHYPALDAIGVRQVAGDLADREAVMAAFAGGFDAVFHNAAKAGAWGSYDSYHQANVVGTQHVLDACRAHGIGRLVYTSTPSVTHRATHPVEGGTADDVPYGDDLKAPYALTKRIAEEDVLAANGAELANGARLATIALRPRLIWGPGDNQLLPRLVERAKAGRLALVGDGQNRIDTTCIDNAAQDAPGAASAAGLDAKVLSVLADPAADEPAQLTAVRMAAARRLVAGLPAVSNLVARGCTPLVRRAARKTLEELVNVQYPTRNIQ